MYIFLCKACGLEMFVMMRHSHHSEYKTSIGLTQCGCGMHIVVHDEWPIDRRSVLVCSIGVTHISR